MSFEPAAVLCWVLNEHNVSGPRLFYGLLRSDLPDGYEGIAVL